MLLFALLLTGCPEAPAPDASNGTPPAMDGAPQPPGQGGGQQGGPPTMPSFTVEPGAGVKISGEVTYAGATKGTARIDIFQVGSDGRPMIMHVLMLEKTGPWELEVPKGTGKVNLLAFIDTEGNGPQLAEPSALMKDVNIEEAAVPSLNFALVDGAPNDFATDSPNMPPPPTPGANPDPSAGGPPSGAGGPPGGAGGPPGGAGGPPGGAGGPPGGAPPAGGPPGGAPPAGGPPGGAPK